ncbi:iron-sulfur cluster assembly scaffold protein [Candidatus Uhrbacteria bacterium CG22_combo_CG10-13_8_21_14_all_47_17]|uniref:Iron-sulfur cluster assembly scaffold protein n=1 Tax=Candidatus Uhrbacteria bacterium CG22_combo_CG10-13_8_21_14_all_47_17 TaxID=1975041 RepID=A0A2H0BUI4_9BACT|nr:MAG: iron-sulfur cluster assembly scaffold protein [Candidatus Uhrbacteria bacterium CG22_combo_CG10-13_8_21_14_all_47_17]
MSDPIIKPTHEARKGDVVTPAKGKGWFYTDMVKEHFFSPKNFLEDEASYKQAYLGMVGSPACGDAMKVWLKIETIDGVERIKDFKWKTFGCASAIASTSMLSVMITEEGGMPVEDALKLRPQDIMERLGGLPARKVHCSVLGDKALRSAINDYFRKSGQHDRVEVEHGRLVDKVLKITDHDIEEAVLEGADTLEKLQEKIKVGTGDPSCIPDVEQLLRFYKEKHFGA